MWRHFILPPCTTTKCQLTREKLLHTQRLPEHGSAHLQLRETRALAKREEKTIDLGAQIFCYCICERRESFSSIHVKLLLSGVFKLLKSNFNSLGTPRGNANDVISSVVAEMVFLFAEEGMKQGKGEGAPGPRTKVWGRWKIRKKME